jgi:FkbM family methyltransferase
MPIPRPIADPLLSLLSAALHASPFKTRLGGISTVTAKVFGLHARTEVRTARLRNGIRLPVRLSDYNGRMLYLFGTPDPKVVTVCRTLLRKNDVFLDIGANFGTVGLLSHDAVGPGGRVHFVEPQPELAGIIRNAVAKAGVPAEVHNCGIWDEDGELTLSIPDKHTGAATLAGNPGAARGITVPVRSIASFLDDTVKDRPFGAKVDVEGAEPKILPTILAHPSLRFVLFECNVPEVRAHAWELIGAKRLAFFGLSKHLFSVRLRAVRTRAELDAVHDVLAVRMDPDRAPTGEFHPRALPNLIST